MIAPAGPARPHPRASLAAQLRALGVRPGGTVLVHAGLRGLGFPAAGPEAVLLALRDVLGPVGDGTGRLVRQRAAADVAVDWLARNRRTEEP